MAAFLSTLALLSMTVAATSATAAQPQRDIYEVLGTSTPQLRTAVSRTGVDMVESTEESSIVIATADKAKELRALGFTVERRGSVPSNDVPSNDAATSAITDFPPGDQAYHTYAETTAELQQTQSSFPALAKLTSVGNSYQGRALNMIKISDNVATDENEPEVLFTCNQHAREHLTTEMCLRIVKRFTSLYATDANIKKMVDTHEIYVIPNVNPDGSEYDISGGTYHMWRKNRQGSGTDTNRNWGYKWGCCGGSSGSPSSETYRGPSAFSAPESKAVADFVNGRVVGGAQQIKTHIDFHTYSELVLWPFGWTYNNTAPGMTQAEYDKFATLGKQMAATNGYTPEQSSDLYITDGAVNDWMWGTHKILSYTFEMYPKGSNPGFYPPGSAIPAQTQRNDKAVDLIINAAV
ncbi:M14 family metallopeptidase [Amycolatopsis sp. cg5]|uniref:M14 family metallopeptidase n=1 Tax=Amycolatopsis sp. cg5 TaxID=3238802 RepID=UPI0035250C85